jgi:hypothetical protein
MTKQDRLAITHLLDQLCEHEESVIECATLSDGSHGPGRGSGDAISYAAARRSRRVWRRAQDLIIKLEAEDNALEEAETLRKAHVAALNECGAFLGRVLTAQRVEREAAAHLRAAAAP